MDFSFSDEQQEIRGSIKKLLAEIVTDTELKALAKEGRWHVDKAWKALAEAGMLGLALPEDVGGAGMGLIELVLMLQQVGRTVAQLPAIPTLVSAARPIAAHGTAAQKELLRGVVAGERILTAALVQYDTGDAKRPTARATKEGTGYRLQGVFTNVPYLPESERVLVPARTGDSTVGVFLVDPRAAGISVAKQVGTHGEPLSELTLDGVLVGAEDILGDPNGGQAILDRLVDETVLACCAVEHGLAEGAIFMTANYAKERKQFGVPIGAFQGVTQRVGDAYIDLEAMKVTLFQAAWLMSVERPYANALAVAKFWAAEGGARIVAAAQHVHGGMGFDRDYPLHRYFLTSKVLEFTFGGAETQLAQLGAALTR